MKKELSYTEAYNELQTIASNLENGNYEIDELSEKIKRAGELVNFCKEKLRKIEDDINEVLNSPKSRS
jgi:exodeoxyribonuclease VII small subunit